jgi:hypothetical protein
MIVLTICLNVFKLVQFLFQRNLNFNINFDLIVVAVRFRELRVGAAGSEELRRGGMGKNQVSTK